MSDLDDPEDGFDASDPVPIRLRNLIARLRFVVTRLLELDDEVLDDERLFELVARVERIRDDLRTVAEELEP